MNYFETPSFPNFQMPIGSSGSSGSSVTSGSNWFSSALKSFGSSGITSLGSGLGSWLLNSIFNSDQRQLRNARKFQEMQIAANKELYDYQFAKEAEYNDPSAQRNRIEEANLSPALMYGGAGSTGGVSAQIGNSGLERMGNPVNFGTADPEAVSRIEVNKALADKYRTEAAGNRGETMPALDIQALRTAETNRFIAETKYFKEKANTEKERTIAEQLENTMRRRKDRIQSATEDVSIQRIKDEAQQVHGSLEILGYEIARSQADKDLLPYYKAKQIQEYNNMCAEYLLLEVQARLNEAGIKKSYAEIQLMASKSEEAKAAVQKYMSEVGLNDEKAKDIEKTRGVRKAKMISDIANQSVGTIIRGFSAYRSFGLSEAGKGSTGRDYKINNGDAQDSPVYWWK